MKDFDKENLVATFAANGYCEISNYVEIDKLAVLHDKAIRNLNEILSEIQKRNLEFGVGCKNGFKEIVQRHALRYEMPYGMDSDYDCLLCNEIFEIAREILHSEEVDIVNRSIIVSLPGTKVLH